MSRQLLLYYHYQLRAHQNISTKCYACWYYQVRNFINILKQLIGRLFFKKCENRIISEGVFIKPQIGGSTYRQTSTSECKLLVLHHRPLLNHTGRLGEQRDLATLNDKKPATHILTPPANSILTWSNRNEACVSGPRA